LRRLRIGEVKKEDRKKKNTGQKYNLRIGYTQGGHNKKPQSKNILAYPSYKAAIIIRSFAASF